MHVRAGARPHRRLPRARTLPRRPCMQAPARTHARPCLECAIVCGSLAHMHAHVLSVHSSVGLARDQQPFQGQSGVFRVGVNVRMPRIYRCLGRPGANALPACPWHPAAIPLTYWCPRRAVAACACADPAAGRGHRNDPHPGRDPAKRHQARKVRAAAQHSTAHTHAHTGAACTVVAHACWARARPVALSRGAGLGCAPCTCPGSTWVRAPGRLRARAPARRRVYCLAFQL